MTKLSPEATSPARLLGGLVCVVGLMWSLAAPAKAGFVDGIALLEYCKDPQSNLCGGYLAALVDYQDALQVTDTPAIMFCLPERTNLGGLRDMVIGVLEKQTPRELTKNAASLIVPAFAKAFRCP